MNQSQYLSELVTAINANNSISITGTTANNITELGGNAIDVGSGDIGNATLCVCIADNDTNLSSIKTNSNTLAGTVTSGKLQCEVKNTPSVTVSSGSLTVSGSVSLTGSTNNVVVSNFPATQPVSGTINSNLNSIKGSSINNDVGVVGPGTLRVCLATDDVNTAAAKVYLNTIQGTVDIVNGRINVADTYISHGFGNADSSCTRIVTANDDPVSVLGIDLDACIDKVNHHLEVDLNALNGVLLSTDAGNNGSGVQRIAIATDDINLAAINTNINTLSGTVTSSKLQCEITNTPAVTVSSGSINATCSGTVSVSNFPATQPVSGSVSVSGAVTLSGSSNAVNATCSGTVAVTNSDLTTIAGAITSSKMQTNITNASIPVTNSDITTIAGSITSSKIQANVAQMNGVTVSMGSGVNGTGVQRVSMATDDTLFSNMTKLLGDYRFLITNYVPVQIGGMATLSGNTVYYVVPNNSSYTYTESNVAPPAGNSSITINGSGSKDFTGVDGAQNMNYWYYAFNNSTLITGADSMFSNSEALSQFPYEVTRWFSSAFQNSTTNINDLVMQNYTGTYVAFIPSGWTEAPKWYVQVPGNGGRVYLKNLVVMSCETASGTYYGCTVKIMFKIWNKNTGVLNLSSMVFQQYFKGQQGSVTVDLSHIGQFGNTTNFGAGYSTGTYCSTICLYVKGDSATTQNVGVYLNCNVYRT